jgi:hypothetical protein
MAAEERRRRRARMRSSAALETDNAQDLNTRQKRRVMSEEEEAGGRYDWLATEVDYSVLGGVGAASLALQIVGLAIQLGRERGRVSSDAAKRLATATNLLDDELRNSEASPLTFRDAIEMVSRERTDGDAPALLVDAVLFAGYSALSAYQDVLKARREASQAFETALEFVDSVPGNQEVLEAFRTHLEARELIREGRWDALRKGHARDVAAAERSAGKATGIRFFVSPGRATAEDIQGVLVALNELHIAAGGNGFTFRVDGDRVHVLDMETV